MTFTTVPYLIFEVADEVARASPRSGTENDEITRSPLGADTDSLRLAAGGFFSTAVRLDFAAVLGSAVFEFLLFVREFAVVLSFREFFAGVFAFRSFEVAAFEAVLEFLSLVFVFFEAVFERASFVFDFFGSAFELDFFGSVLAFDFVLVLEFLVAARRFLAGVGVAFAFLVGVAFFCGVGVGLRFCAPAPADSTTVVTKTGKTSIASTKIKPTLLRDLDVSIIVFSGGQTRTVLGTVVLFVIDNRAGISLET